ncbi:hypothetical protein DFH06DRAFT_1213316 [Mycena polygramma]|nr:hypothetical protein DFH06DRAFT_1213316 [Mycena polygramma]
MSLVECMHVAGRTRGISAVRPATVALPGRGTLLLARQWPRSFKGEAWERGTSRRRSKGGHKRAHGATAIWSSGICAASLKHLRANEHTQKNARRGGDGRDLSQSLRIHLATNNAPDAPSRPQTLRRSFDTIGLDKPDFLELRGAKMKPQ